ncbi:MAG: AAA family ATPase [Terrisporobacter sp.]
MGFERNILSVALKYNNQIKKAMITGILRVVKESIFSGRNNLEVYTFYKNKFKIIYGKFIIICRILL